MISKKRNNQFNSPTQNDQKNFIRSADKFQKNPFHRVGRLQLTGKYITVYKSRSRWHLISPMTLFKLRKNLIDRDFKLVLNLCKI